jgi:hypothetical protein
MGGPRLAGDSGAPHRALLAVATLIYLCLAVGGVEATARRRSPIASRARWRPAPAPSSCRLPSKPPKTTPQRRSSRADHDNAPITTTRAANGLRPRSPNPNPPPSPSLSPNPNPPPNPNPSPIRTRTRHRIRSCPRTRTRHRAGHQPEESAGQSRSVFSLRAGARSAESDLAPPDAQVQLPPSHSVSHVALGAHACAHEPPSHSMLQVVPSPQPVPHRPPSHSMLHVAPSPQLSWQPPPSHSMSHVLPSAHA